MKDFLDHANELYREGKFDASAKAYSEFLEKNPNHILALTGLGLSNIKIGRISEAIESFTSAISIAPDIAQLYSERGVAYFHHAKLQEALEDMDKAQDLEPENPYRYSSRAFILDRMGNLTGAIKDYEKAISLDPEDAVSYNNLGLIQEKMGHHAVAKSNFQIADAKVNQSPMPEIKKRTASGQSITDRKQKPTKPLTFTQYFQTVISVVTTKKGFHEFIQYLFKGKNNHP